MIIWKNEKRLLDTDEYKLNFGLLNFNDYRSATEKLIKSESFSFNDSYVYKPNTYQGYNTALEILIRDIKRKEFLSSLRRGNRLSLPKEKDVYREYYIDGEIKTNYYSEGYSKLTIPIYFNAFKYNISEKVFSFEKGLIHTINNDGDVYAEPVITIRGNGNLIFSINGTVHTLRNSQGGYIVNCKNKEQGISNLDGIPKNVTSEYIGGFPVLETGTNEVQLISGESLEIKVNWRWID